MKRVAFLLALALLASAPYQADAAIAFVKSNEGTSALSSVTPGFGSATTSGNLIVLAIAADDYNGSPTSGWTQSSEMEQQVFHGAYIWWRISAGETNFTAYTIGSATNSAWEIAEFSGVDATPYDGSQGQSANGGGPLSYTTDSLTPTAGARLLVVMMGGSKNASQAATTLGTWLNSFTGIDSIGSGGAGTNNAVGLAYQLVTANGSTAYSSGATYSASQESFSGLIIAFEAAAGGGTKVPIMNQRKRR